MDDGNEDKGELDGIYFIFIFFVAEKIHNEHTHAARRGDIHHSPTKLFIDKIYLHKRLPAALKRECRFFLSFLFFIFQFCTYLYRSERESEIEREHK